MLSKLLTITSIIFLSISINSQAGYRVISHDYIVDASKITFSFNPSLVKESVEVSFQRCPTCKWLNKTTTAQTKFFLTEVPISFTDFKKQIKSDQKNPSKEKQRALISIDIRNDNIFNIKWNYVEK